MTEDALTASEVGEPSAAGTDLPTGAERDPIARLARVPLRAVWKHEAYDFTTWLQENLDVLSDAIDVELASAEREQSTGNFSVDLIAEDQSGRRIVIENQLGKSDHDHLGKILTYLAAMEAKAAVWIVAEPRPEHVGAVSWLNESSSAQFYLLKIEAVRIGDSPPAPLLTLIVGPSEEVSDVGAVKKDWADRHKLRYRFWQQLLERAAPRSSRHRAISPSWASYVSAGAGKSGLTFSYNIRQHDGEVQLNIDRGRDSADENERIFDLLAGSKEMIEQDFGEPLDWRRLESKRSCRICKVVSAGGYRDSEEKWPEIQDAMIDAMVRLDKAMSPRLKKLPF